MPNIFSRKPRSAKGELKSGPASGDSGNKAPKLWPDAAAGKIASVKVFIARDLTIEKLFSPPPLYYPAACVGAVFLLERQLYSVEDSK